MTALDELEPDEQAEDVVISEVTRAERSSTAPVVEDDDGDEEEDPLEAAKTADEDREAEAREKDDET